MSKNNSTFYINSGALIGLQMANYVLPFLILPYLTRTLGKDLYGIVAFGLAMTQIGLIITDYGFNLSATYRIARHQNDKNYVQNIASAVFIIKSFLCLISVLILSTYILTQTKYEEFRFFFMLMHLSLLGQTFQPIWFFQGIEKMPYITIFTIISKILYLILVLLLVQTKDSYTFVAVANGVAQILAATIGIYMIYRLGYRLRLPNKKFIIMVFKDSTQFFWSRAAVATYTSCGTFFLGLFGLPAQVASYSVAEQLYKGGRSVFDPITQALYPHMAKERNFKLFKKVLGLSLIVAFTGLIIGIWQGEWIITFIFGVEFINSYSTLVLFMIAIMVTVPSVFLGYPFLGAIGKIKLANQSVIYAGALQFILLAICYSFDFFEANHIVTTIIIVETLVLILRLRWSYQYFKS